MCYVVVVFVCFFKQKTAYEMRISDWSSDVCSSDLLVYEGDRRFDVTVRVPEATRVNLDDIRSLPVLLPEEAGATRRQIPLAQVAQIRLTEGLNQISRENGKRRVVVQDNLEGRDAGSFVQDAQAQIAQVKLQIGKASGRERGCRDE